MIDLTKAPRDQLIRIILADRELRRRDDKRRAEESLIAFVELMWAAVEPETPFVSGWPLEAICDHLEAVTRGEIVRLLMNVPPGSTKSLVTDCFWPAWEWGPRGIPHLRYLCCAYAAHLTERDNRRFKRIIEHPLYQAYWGDRFAPQPDMYSTTQVGNDRTGWKLASSVGGVGTGERADRVVIDDPNNPQQAESELVMRDTTTWFREVMPDRLNSLERSAIVVIQQRTHDMDVSGTILDLGLPYCHLSIPMRFDARRAITPTAIGWVDPRALDQDGNVLDDEALLDRDGELAWPERFSYDALLEMEKAKGSYAFCTPAESPILMGDISFKPIGHVKIGDQVIGYHVRRPGERRHLVVTEVLDISVSRRPVVRITLDSGKVIRCTADHRWYTGREDETHPLYAPARIGRKLLRVCNDHIPVLTDEEDLRAAGWLAGFFDADGSAVTVMRRKEGSPSCLISFSQGTGRNAGLCQKLESTLRRFGMEFSYKVRDCGDHAVNWYYLRGKRMDLYQRFVHMIRPTKWRDRIIAGAIGARFVQGKESVVSIMPDGEETVYGLTTGTGNYVVWGLASSNSAQYQMLPVPRGGGIIKDSWWQLWEDDHFPEYGTCIASLDTAFKVHQEADYSALTVWAAFAHPESGKPKLMMRDAWQERLDLAALSKRVVATCREHKVDTLLIEDAARGGDVEDEIYRLVGKREIKVVLVRPAGDKVSRVNATVPIFENGIVYAPDREWADMVIRQVSVFPFGRHDDLVDTVAQALIYLRKTGVATRRQEWDEMELAQRVYRKPQKALYDV